MGHVWVITKDNRRFLFNTNSESADSWSDRHGRDTLYHTVHDHWILKDGSSYRGSYTEITKHEALEFFTDAEMDPPFALESLALFLDIDIHNLRDQQSVQYWPWGAEEDDEVICFTGDGRWIIDIPRNGTDRYRVLSVSGAIRYFSRRKLEPPLELIDDIPGWLQLDDDSLPAPRTNRGLPAPKPLPVEWPYSDHDDDDYFDCDTTDYSISGYTPASLPENLDDYVGPHVIPGGELIAFNGIRQKVNTSAFAFLEALVEAGGEWVTYKTMCHDHPDLSGGHKSRTKTTLKNLFPDLVIESGPKGYRLSPQYWPGRRGV